MRKCFRVFLLVFLSPGCILAQDLVIKGYGDLHILHNKNNSIRVIGANADESVLDTTFAQLPKNLRFHYFAADKKTNLDFEFELHNRIKHSWRQEEPEKTLVVSDLHGRLDAFVAVLKGNGVINDKLDWIYGKNQLIYLGDVLDRGRDDNGIAWLLYKLEQEAEDSRGRLDFIVGNHEDLVMKDDIRYTHEAHLIFAAKVGMPYYELYGIESELGQWFRDSYLILTVGDNLFVHAGVSPKMVERSYKIGEINELGARFVGYPTKQREKMHPRNELLFGSSGPLWYRGLVANSEKHPGISSEDLDKVLSYYKTRRIIVGHSEVDEIDWRYDGRVIAVNVRHYDNYPENRTAGILIEYDHIYAINYTGSKDKLK